MNAKLCDQHLFFPLTAQKYPVNESTVANTNPTSDCSASRRQPSQLLLCSGRWQQQQLWSVCIQWLDHPVQSDSHACNSSYGRSEVNVGPSKYTFTPDIRRRDCHQEPPFEHKAERQQKLAVRRASERTRILASASATIGLIACSHLGGSDQWVRSVPPRLP